MNYFERIFYYYKNKLHYYIKYKNGTIPNPIELTQSLQVENSAEQLEIKKSEDRNIEISSYDYELIAQSNLFNSGYYLNSNPDVKEAGLDPIVHYCVYGWKEFRNPCKEFNTRFYLSTYPDIEKSSINPLLHYLQFGKKEGRSIKQFEFDKEECVSKADISNDSKSILFIAHDVSKAGAETLLLNLLNWFHENTEYKLFVIALQPGIDGGRLLFDYKKLASVFIWKEYCSDNSYNEAIMLIRTEIGKIDLIYGNTIISPILYPLLEVFDAPYITHVHEMEKSIKNYVTDEHLENLKKYSEIIIPCSNPVLENLITNHGINAGRLKLVPAFIQIDSGLKKEKGPGALMNVAFQNKKVIWGCGTIYWRKGTDLFIQTAKKLKDSGLTDFVFCWIGENFWDVESSQWGNWVEWEKYISLYKLDDIILFTGQKDNPKYFYKEGDIFYLPSREDPFPLVCLEAAECGLPVICFESAGGMPEFVEDDAGSVIPYLSIDEAAIAIEILLMDTSLCLKKGQTAKKKVLKGYTDEIAMPQIHDICKMVMNSNGS